MSYLDDLKNNSKPTQKELEFLLSEYEVQPIGNGYIDMITANDLVVDFINGLTIRVWLSRVLPGGVIVQKSQKKC